MADCGTEYISIFEYRVEGDAELYGDDEWRIGKIIWNTTDDWKKAGEEYTQALEDATDENGRMTHQPDPGILDDESMACDWDEYEVQDENGDVMPEAAAKEVTALLP